MVTPLELKVRAAGLSAARAHPRGARAASRVSERRRVMATSVRGASMRITGADAAGFRKVRLPLPEDADAVAQLLGVEAAEAAAEDLDGAAGGVPLADLADGARHLRPRQGVVEDDAAA